MKCKLLVLALLVSACSCQGSTEVSSSPSTGRQLLKSHDDEHRSDESPAQHEEEKEGYVKKRYFTDNDGNEFVEYEYKIEEDESTADHHHSHSKHSSTEKKSQEKLEKYDDPNDYTLVKSEEIGEVEVYDPESSTTHVIRYVEVTEIKDGKETKSLKEFADNTHAKLEKPNRSSKEQSHRHDKRGHSFSSSNGQKELGIRIPGVSRPHTTEPRMRDRIAARHKSEKESKQKDKSEGDEEVDEDEVVIEEDESKVKNIQKANQVEYSYKDLVQRKRSSNDKKPNLRGKVTDEETVTEIVEDKEEEDVVNVKQAPLSKTTINTPQISKKHVIKPPVPVQLKKDTSKDDDSTEGVLDYINPMKLIFPSNPSPKPKPKPHPEIGNHNQHSSNKKVTHIVTTAKKDDLKDEYEIVEEDEPTKNIPRSFTPGMTAIAQSKMVASKDSDGDVIEEYEDKNEMMNPDKKAVATKKPWNKSKEKPKNNIKKSEEIEKVIEEEAEDQGLIPPKPKIQPKTPPKAKAKIPAKTATGKPTVVHNGKKNNVEFEEYEDQDPAIDEFTVTDETVEDKRKIKGTTPKLSKNTPQDAKVDLPWDKNDLLEECYDRVEQFVVQHDIAAMKLKLYFERCRQRFGEADAVHETNKYSSFHGKIPAANTPTSTGVPLILDADDKLDDNERSELDNLASKLFPLPTTPNELKSYCEIPFEERLDLIQSAWTLDHYRQCVLEKRIKKEENDCKEILFENFELEKKYLQDREIKRCKQIQP